LPFGGREPSQKRGIDDPCEEVLMYRHTGSKSVPVQAVPSNLLSLPLPMCSSDGSRNHEVKWIDKAYTLKARKGHERPRCFCIHRC
jgi:hypothetical protein